MATRSNSKRFNGVEISGNSMKNGVSFLSVPHDFAPTGQWTVNNNSLEDVEHFVHIRDAKSDLRHQLGIPGIATSQEVLEALTALKTVAPTDAAAAVAAIPGTSAERWVAAGGSLATIADGMFKLLQSGAIDAAISAFTGI